MRTNFESYLKSKRFTSSSIRTRMLVFDMFIDWLKRENLEAEQVGYNDLMEWVKYKNRKGTSQKTIQHYMGTIRHFYDHLIREGKVEINPAKCIEIKGIKRKVLHHILEMHELHKLYNQMLDEGMKERREKVMLGLLINQGVTTAELGKLEVKDVNLRSGMVRIPGGIKSESREMKLEAHQVMDMFDYVQNVRPALLETDTKRKSQTKQTSDKLFIAPGGNPSNISNMMTQLMIKLRKLNPTLQNAKQIRTSVITRWLKVNNLRETQYLAGHRYISSTESYQENDLEGLSEEVQMFHPLG